MSRDVYLSKLRGEAAEQAAKDLKDHRIVDEGPGRWFFGKPRDSHFACRIIEAPYCLILYGDAGDLMFRPNTENALGWLTTVVSRDNYDLAYIAEKVPPDLRSGIREFQPDLVRQWLHEEMDEASQEGNEKYHKSLAEMAVEFKAYYADERVSHPVYTWWYDSMAAGRYDCSDAPEFEGLTYHFMFQVELLRQFTIKLAAWRKAAA